MMKAAPKGQTLVEYALIIALVAVGAILSLQTLGDQVSNTYTSTSNAIGTANTPLPTGGSNFAPDGVTPDDIYSPTP